MMRTVFSGRVPLLVAGVFLLMMPGASAAPQFVPPNGLPLDTPLGPERNADGSGVISFRTMGREIAQNATAIGALADQAVTKDDLDTALAPYQTQRQAAETYLPKAGGTVQTLAVSASFTPPKMTYEQATASTCTVGTLYYITNGQKFWSNASFGGADNSQVLIASDAGQEGGFYGCVSIGPGQTRIVPLVVNYNGGAR
ncbi:hypothetical protein [Asaia prunellae]|uniref:hypothetical protein n=1 Tax=Asaia prunellae TaxID=610245 RepID=UPI0004723476|nr:hypothetical protein [Asaia prunellae]